MANLVERKIVLVWFVIMAAILLWCLIQLIVILIEELKERIESFRKKDKKDLREVCRKKYGDDFVKMYDMVNRGIPIGNIEETIIFINMVEVAKMDEVEE